jgi:hypothetical protein
MRSLKMYKKGKQTPGNARELNEKEIKLDGNSPLQQLTVNGNLSLPLQHSASLFLSQIPIQ